MKDASGSARPKLVELIGIGLTWDLEFVFDKFNYSSEKIFSIEVWESNGDRIFDMKVESSDLLKVKYLN